ncbi:MAG: hypothetical protein HY337_11505, partial [Gemmatimonadetes bacterium]|nr:hypothetical protein [Gemmatimonadota bacterium]
MPLRHLFLKVLPAVCAVCARTGAAAAQQPTRSDSARTDSLRRFTLESVTVSVTRAPTDIAHVPLAVAVVGRDEVARGRATAGLDEALVTVPG